MDNNKDSVVSTTKVPLPSERVANATFTLCGAMCIALWNSYISGVAYLDKEAFAGMDWELYSTQVFQTTLLVSMSFMFCFGDRLSTTFTYVGTMALNICFIAIFLFVVIGPLSKELSFKICLCLTSVFSFTAAVFQAIVSRTMNVAVKHYSTLPARYSMGNGLIGMSTFFLALIIQRVFTPFAACIALFIYSALLAAATLAASGVFMRIEAASTPRRPGASLASGDELQTVEGEATVEDKHEEFVEPWSNLRSARAGFVYEAAIFAILLTTFLVFPAACANWTGRGVIPSTLYPTVVMGAFQVFDVVGRGLVDFAPKSWSLGSPIKLWCGIVLRGIMVPFFYACIGDAPGILGTQAFQLAFQAVFATLNGMQISLAFGAVPFYVPEAARGTVGLVMVFCLAVGIAAGSSLATIAL